MYKWFTFSEETMPRLEFAIDKRVSNGFAFPTQNGVVSVGAGAFKVVHQQFWNSPTGLYNAVICVEFD